MIVCERVSGNIIAFILVSVRGAQLNLTVCLPSTRSAFQHKQPQWFRLFFVKFALFNQIIWQWIRLTEISLAYLINWWWLRRDPPHDCRALWVYNNTQKMLYKCTIHSFKLVLWNRPRGVRSQKTHTVNLWFAACLNQRNKSDHIFSIVSYCIESHCWIEIESHYIGTGVNHITTLAALYVSSVYRIVGYALRCVSQLWRCTSLVYIYTILNIT